MEPRDRAAVISLYTNFATVNDGNLDRTAITWDRIERPPASRTDPARSFVIEGPAGLEAYIFLNQPMPVPPGAGKHEVHVHDMAAATPRGALALWSFLGGYTSLATEIVWNAGPNNPLLAILPEQVYRMTLRHHWMIRITEISAAAAARGYPAHIRGSLHLKVRDSVIEPNAGSWTLNVKDGTGLAHPCDEHNRHSETAQVSLDITALAALFAGFMSPWSLKLMGVLEGDDSSLAHAAAIFPCSSPWMSDMF
jgi:predicted acetyltransferase